MAEAVRVRIDSFRQVLLRHGLSGLVLALICLIPEQPRTSVQASLRLFETQGERIASIALLLLAVMVIASAFGRGGLSARQWAWLGYLLLVSIAEEWAFRFALPLWLMPAIGLLPAIALCNLAFGAMHRFTLGWGWARCLGATLGAFGLSLLLARTSLLHVIALHWLVTFANTPWPPRGRAISSPSPAAG